MRLTRRGYAVALVVALAVVSAWLFGARGLNGIAGPGVVALAYATVQVWRVDEPVVDRDLPSRAEQGSTVTVTLSLEADRPYSAWVTDATDDGLEADGNDRAVTVGSEPVGYELFFRRRGERAVGPATVVARDVLGLVARSFSVGGKGTVLVRPPVVPLSGPRADELVWTFGGGDDRQQFDFLRHYRRGDPLRDIHWPSSAKVPGEGLVVKHFGADEGANAVRIAAESTGDHADEMAAAAASLAVHLLVAGLRVGLVTVDAHVDARGGVEQRDRVLDALARTQGRRLRSSDREAADVLVSADEAGVTVRFGDDASPFAEVAGREVAIPARDGPAPGLVDRLGGMA